MSWMADCVVLLADRQSSAAVTRLWAEIERRWGAGRSHPDAPPHLSLAVVLDPSPGPLLIGAVSALALRHPALRATATSYGVFAGAEPVVHLAITETPGLAALHEDLVASLERTGLSVDPETRPQYWRPHLNLADRGVTPSMAGEITAFLLENGPRHWTLELAVMALLDGSGVPAPTFPLGSNGRRPSATDRDQMADPTGAST